MRYAINLNLDYESHPHEQVKALFRAIRDGLSQVGFRRDGRLFTIDLPGEEARALARQVVEQAAARLGCDPGAYLKEFYGFDFEQSVSLMPGPPGEIGVEELADLELEEIQITPPPE